MVTLIFDLNINAFSWLQRKAICIRVAHELVEPLLATNQHQATKELFNNGVDAPMSGQVSFDKSETIMGYNSFTM